MRRLTAEFVAELPGIRLARGLAPAALGPEPRFWFQDHTVTALDGLLAPGASRPVDVPPGADFLAATPDLALLIFATKHDVLLVGATGLARAPIAEADSAVVLASGRVLVTAPQGDKHAAHLLDPATGKVVDVVGLDTYDAGVTAVPHPGDGWVALDAGEGQDGSTVFRVREENGRLVAEELMSDAVLAGFDPSGSRVLITPHPSFGGPAEVLSWPGLDPIAALDDLDLDIYGAFAGADRVLLSTFEEGPLLCTGDLEPLGLLDLSAYPVADFEDTQLLGLGPDTFALDLYHDGAGHTTVWRIPG